MGYAECTMLSKQTYDAMLIFFTALIAKILGVIAVLGEYYERALCVHRWECVVQGNLCVGLLKWTFHIFTLPSFTSFPRVELAIGGFVTLISIFWNCWIVGAYMLLLAIFIGCLELPFFFDKIDCSKRITEKLNGMVLLSPSFLCVCLTHHLPI